MARAPREHPARDVVRLLPGMGPASRAAGEPLRRHVRVLHRGARAGRRARSGTSSRSRRRPRASGSAFDDMATGLGLGNHFRRAVRSGAITQRRDGRAARIRHAADRHRPMTFDTHHMPTQRRDFLGWLGGSSLFALGGVPVARASAFTADSAHPAPLDDKFDVSWADKVQGKFRAVFDSPEISEGAALFRAMVWCDEYKSVYGTARCGDVAGARRAPRGDPPRDERHVLAALQDREGGEAEDARGEEMGRGESDPRLAAGDAAAVRALQPRDVPGRGRHRARVRPRVRRGGGEVQEARTNSTTPRRGRRRSSTWSRAWCCSRQECSRCFGLRRRGASTSWPAEAGTKTLPRVFAGFRGYPRESAKTRGKFSCC